MHVFWHARRTGRAAENPVENRLVLCSWKCPQAGAELRVCSESGAKTLLTSFTEDTVCVYSLYILFWFAISGYWAIGYPMI